MFLRTLCRGIPIRSLLGCPFVLQLLHLSHIWISWVFCYSWLMSHVFSWTRKWDFRISELTSSVYLWSGLLDMMRLLNVDCSAYLLWCLLWSSLCQVPGVEYLCHKYFVDFHVRLYLDFLLKCVWVVACIILFRRDWNIWIFCVGFILIENEWHIQYVFDPLMGVITIFCGDGV